jgi:cobalamin biosynthetic protein CobC
VDESFGDIAPETSMIARTAYPGTLVLKSFGKFWGLAGMRLGFAIGHPETLRGPNGRLADMIGPWAVSGPALAIGAAALSDLVWAETTRARLAQDATRLDAMVCARGARLVGGTTLFRLYQVEDAALWQDRLARQRIWSRIFPYSGTWLRLGLPPADGWDRLEQALATMTETAA